MQKTYRYILIPLLLLGFIYSCSVDNLDQITVEDDDVTVQTTLCDSLIVTFADSLLFDELSITVHISGGAEPYAIEWSTGETANKIRITEPGDYSITITDTLGCEITQTYTSDFESPCLDDLSIELDHDGMGLIVAEVSGGNGDLSVQWNNGETGESINVFFSGQYTAWVYDELGCREMATIDIEIQDSGVVCDSLSVGIVSNLDSVTAIVSGGQEPYLYNWINGSSDQTISVGDGGIFSVTIEDSNGCREVSQIVVLGPDCFMLSLTIHEISPGVLSAIVNGGTSPYSYYWPAQDAHTDSITVTESGFYSVVVEDSAGCGTISFLQVNL